MDRQMWEEEEGYDLFGEDEDPYETWAMLREGADALPVEGVAPVGTGLLVQVTPQHGGVQLSWRVFVPADTQGFALLVADGDEDITLVSAAYLGGAGDTAELVEVLNLRPHRTWTFVPSEEELLFVLLLIGEDWSPEDVENALEFEYGVEEAVEALNWVATSPTGDVFTYRVHWEELW